MVAVGVCSACVARAASAPPLRVTKTTRRLRLTATATTASSSCCCAPGKPSVVRSWPARVRAHDSPVQSEGASVTSGAKPRNNHSP
jgi:hypothetical protein